MHKNLSLLLAATLAGTALSAPAVARSVDGAAWDAKERFMVRGRVLGVLADEDGTTPQLGGDVQLNDALVPEVDFSYFLSDHWAMELIVAATPHDAGASNTSAGNLDLGEVTMIPPHLTLQYHFNPHGQIRPYVGAGVGYIFFVDEDAGPSITSIDYQNTFSTALQAGVDYGLDENWGLNADVKKLFFDTDIKMNGGAVTAPGTDVDPWIIGVGVSYRF